MQPLGRKMFRNPNPCKHRVRKSIGEPWWSIPPDKKSERQAVRLGLLKKGKESYMCSYCSNCDEKIDEQDTSILVTEDSQFLCGSCNGCKGCRGILNEHTSDFELWICEDCINAEEQHASDLEAEESED